MADRPTYVWTGSAWDTIADPGAVRNTGGSTITVASGSTVPLTIQNNGTGNSFVVNDVASDTTPFVIDAAGNVGVGTSNPTGFVNSGFAAIGTNAQTQAYLGSSTSGINVGAYTGAVYVQSSSGADVFLGTVSANALVFRTATTERIRVASDGRIQVTAGNVLEAPVVTNAQTTSYTLVLADAGKLVEINNAGATTLTIPADASVAFPVGTKIDVLRVGAGEVSVAGAAGVTVNSEGSKLRINAQWQAVTLIKRATNTWVVIGALKT